MSYNRMHDTFTEAAVTVTCANCGMPFAVPREWEQAKRRTHGDFWCPNGHPLAFHGPTPAEREAATLRKELEREAAARRNAEERAGRLHGSNIALGRKLSAAKGQQTKLRKRIGNGVCPCCNRHFTNVERHMTTQHPEWTAGDTCSPT